MLAKLHWASTARTTRRTSAFSLVGVIGCRRGSIFASSLSEDCLSVVCRAVSDTHKNLLLNNEGFIPLLIDSLLLDKDHPRMDNVTLMGVTDWEAVKVPVQRVRQSSAASVYLLWRHSYYNDES